MVKNLPAKRGAWVKTLDWEDCLEEGTETDSSILAWRIPGQRSLVGYSPRGCKESDMTEQLSTCYIYIYIYTHTHTHTYIYI